jgi:hypothetical protein
MPGVSLGRPDVVRPIVVALAMTLAGEAVILLVWGVVLFPAGALWHKLWWAMICGAAMGLSIGALVNLIVTGRLTPRYAAPVAALIYLSVLLLCVGLCFRIDQAAGLFGANEAPLLFILGGVVPALLTSVVYAWLLYGTRGQKILVRFGL